MKPETPLTTDRINRVCKIIERRGITLSQFAGEIGMSGKYTHIYKWIKERSMVPNGEAMLRIEEWLLKNENKNGKASAGKSSRKKQPAKKDKSK